MLGEDVRVDPIRIVEAVTAGVAFLAAGVVIFTRGQVHGLTTGARHVARRRDRRRQRPRIVADRDCSSRLLALVVLALLYAFESKMDMNQGQDLAAGEPHETGKRAAKAKADKPKEAKPAR